MKNIKKIIPYIILVLVVGLLSLIPYTLEKLNDKEKIVKEKDNFKIKDLSYKIPSGFSASDSYDDDEYASYSYNGDNVYCRVTIYTQNNEYKKYQTGEDYIKDNFLFKLNDKVSEITHDNNWYSIDKITDYNRKEIMTVQTTKDYSYILEYHLSDYSNGEDNTTSEYKVCTSAYEDIIKSLKIKES